MNQSERNIQNQDNAQTKVTSGLKDAQAFARTMDFDDVRSGKWFLALLERVVQAYDRNARADYFQRKYPGLDPDEIADILTSVTVRYAAIAGALTGAASTASMIATLSSAGMTAALWVSTIGAEMLYLARIQMRLVLDLSVVYDLQLDPDDPEDMLMVFGYALGIAPTELLGKGLAQAAAGGTRYAVRKYISKGTLESIQKFASRLGIKILQRTIIKYTVPIASAVAGSSFNYATTGSVGRIAKSHLKSRGKVTDELRQLVSRQKTYDLAFPAAAMYVAQTDGQFSTEERELYRAILSRMTFDDHTQAEFRKLVASEDSLLEALAQIDDDEMRQSLMDVLVLMAVRDGQLTDKERLFLVRTAERLELAMDLAEAELRCEEFRAAVESSLLEKTAAGAREAASRASDAAGRAAEGVRGAVVTARGRASEELAGLRSRFTSAGDQARCANCGSPLAASFAFCTACGQPTAAELTCAGCGEPVPTDASYCPFCGAAQA